MSAPPLIVDSQNLTLPNQLPHLPRPASESSLSSSDEKQLHDSNGHAVYDQSAATSAYDSEEDLVNKYYVPPDGYESKHRWDPKATWTAAEQKKLTRKLDRKVALVACICFVALQLDRGNISNALSDNFVKDLHMTTNDYNTGMTIFYLCFLSAELPSQLISKKLGSDVWIPIQMMSWSIVAISQYALKGKTGFFVTRALLGLIEGGFIADTILYLSYYYTAAELTIRLSFFWVSLTSTTIIGALLAAGILKMRGIHGLPGWSWLFMLEGILTFFIGVFAFFYLPASPTQTVTRWRKTPWFTEREETIIVNKVLRDDPTKSDMHNREGLNFTDLRRSITDFDMWPVYLLGLTTYLAPATVGAYFTLTLKSLGFNTFHTNLLTIPSAVLFIFNNLALGFSSKRFKERLGIASLGSWWQLIFLIVLVAIPNDTSKWAKWAILSLLLAYPYAHPILVSMQSMNAGSVRTRTVASSVYNMFVQASSLVASNVYRTSDAPTYKRGNKVLLAIVSGNLLLFAFAKGYYILKNRSRAKIWDSWTHAQKEEYLRTTTDKGNKKLNYRFQH